jgi:hypothetical protein
MVTVVPVVTIVTVVKLRSFRFQVCKERNSFTFRSSIAFGFSQIFGSLPVRR